MKRILRLILLAGVGTAALGFAPAFAHHSTAAFDNSRVIVIKGKVTRTRWINPHSSFKIDAATDKKEWPNGMWTIEMTAANALIRQGWKRNSIKPGDKVTVFVHPLRHVITLNDGSQGALYIGIILADGSTLGRVREERKGTIDHFSWEFLVGAS